MARVGVSGRQVQEEPEPSGGVRRVGSGMELRRVGEATRGKKSSLGRKAARGLGLGRSKRSRDIFWNKFLKALICQAKEFRLYFDSFARRVFEQKNKMMKVELKRHSWGQSIQNPLAWRHYRQLDDLGCRCK